MRIGTFRLASPVFNLRNRVLSPLKPPSLLFLAVSISLQLPQGTWRPVKEIRRGGVRVVFPVGTSVSLNQGYELIREVTSQDPLPGFPVGFDAQPKITISLATEPREGQDAWSSAETGLIALPLRGALKWDRAKLHRVIRHELAHIQLGRFLRDQEVPLWFEEGFAEWASGGLSCAGALRLSLELRVRQRIGKEVPSLRLPGIDVRSRVAYDFFVSFFDYLEGQHSGVIGSGALLSATATHGLEKGLLTSTGVSLERLEALWQVYLLERYRETPGSISECE